MKSSLQTFLNLYQILRDKRHEQKSKALSFAMMYAILPILLFINLTISLLPDKFFTMLETSIEMIPSQYQPFVSNFINRYSYHDFGFLLYFIVLAFILYIIATNVRLLIEIANDCYEYSEERSKYKELIISIILFLTLTFAVAFIFAIVIAGQALRSFLIINNVPNVADVINSALQMKSLITIITLFVIFYIIYYFAPNVKSTFKATFFGALVSGIGVYVAALVFEIYTTSSHTSYHYLYQSYAKYILFLLGIYVISQIIVGSFILNSLVYEKINVREYHKRVKHIDKDNVFVHLERGNDIMP